MGRCAVDGVLWGYLIDEQSSYVEKKKNEQDTEEKKSSLTSRIAPKP